MSKSVSLLNKMKNDNIEKIDDNTEVEDGFSEVVSGDNQNTIKTFNLGNTKTVPKVVTTVSTKKSTKGITPSIDGEPFNIKRGYQFRESTIRMLNELKLNHQDVNVYLNTIVDAAIRNYYDYIIVQGNKQK